MLFSARTGKLHGCLTSVIDLAISFWLLNDCFFQLARAGLLHLQPQALC